MLSQRIIRQRKIVLQGNITVDDGPRGDAAQILRGAGHVALVRRRRWHSFRRRRRSGPPGVGRERAPGARRGGRPARRRRLSGASDARRRRRLRSESMVPAATVADVVDVVRIDGHVAPWAGPLPVGVGALSPGMDRRAADASDPSRRPPPADTTLRLMYNSQQQLADDALPSVFVEELQECWRARERRRASI